MAPTSGNWPDLVYLWLCTLLTSPLLSLAGKEAAGLEYNPDEGVLDLP